MMEILQDDTNWLNEVLDEVGLQTFYSKLTNDLQLTKLSHFDYVSEDDLIQVGLSRPAARRLLASVKKRKSFVTALKNKIVNKLLPSTSTSVSHGNTKQKSRPSHDLYFENSISKSKQNLANINREFERLTCLINSQDVQIKEEIGHGVHGFVKKGEWTAPNGRVVEVALKILRKEVMSEPGASFNDFVKEISVMHQLNHPNIIKLYGVVLSSPMMMVTELAPFGNLRDKLRKERGNTPISQLINFGVQVTSGMEYLESKRFAHRDLAARNIFISHGKKILIGDLGLMRAIPNQENHYVMSEKTKIPFPWCAPESLRYKQFSSSSDVYMFGVTMWEMFSFGSEPWAGLSLNEILENISSQKKRLQCPEACPTMVYQTLLQCWNTDPSCRPNFSTLYQYLSTSYPLEVRSTQHISEISQKREKGILQPDDTFVETSSSKNILTINDGDEDNKSSYRRVLNCNVDDRILVIDGQPEKYWWKGQNQRTFEIGWFPLCSTRWLAPKKSPNYISKPLKNSFVHTAHCGPDGKWGNPSLINHMHLKNHLEAEDVNNISSAMKSSFDNRFTRNLPKNKTKSKLSRLFGINETSHTFNALPLQLPYEKFINEQRNSCQQSSLVKSDTSSITSHNTPEDPLLIDFSDELDGSTQLPQVESSFHIEQKSLIDADHSFSLVKHSSETDINQRNYVDDSRLSWNTGTFDGSYSNIYSNYYYPQDALNRE